MKRVFSKAAGKRLLFFCVLKTSPACAKIKILRKQQFLFQEKKG